MCNILNLKYNNYIYYKILISNRLYIKYNKSLYRDNIDFSVKEISTTNSNLIVIKDNLNI